MLQMGYPTRVRKEHHDKHAPSTLVLGSGFSNRHCFLLTLREQSLVSPIGQRPALTDYRHSNLTIPTNAPSRAQMRGALPWYLKGLETL